MNHWLIVQHHAWQYLQEQREWESFKIGKRYRVVEVTDTNIKIERVSGGKFANLGKKAVNKAAERLRKEQAMHGKKLFNAVAKRSAFFRFHPHTNYDSVKHQAIWQSGPLLTAPPPDIDKIIDAADDEEIRRIERQIRLRKHQSEFKKKLIQAYGHRCLFTGEAPLEVLEAAHIIRHSETGNNKTANGLLLRADIHQLFDLHLLVIRPSDLTVAVHPRLQHTHYGRLEGLIVQLGTHQAVDSRAYLHERFKSIDWVNTLTQ